jgi:hypothetical protein
LKELITKEALDDTATSNMADIYQKTMARTREYEYHKLYTAPSQRDYRTVMRPIADCETKTTTKFTKKNFVHEVSDADQESKASLSDSPMEEPTIDANQSLTQLLMMKR